MAGIYFIISHAKISTRTRQFIQEFSVTDSQQTKVGQVKWFNAAKGFGFITYDEKDFFVYYSDIVATGYKTLDEGQKVKFEPSMGDKGCVAKNVEVLS